jgi:hypothetical protein
MAKSLRLLVSAAALAIACAPCTRLLASSEAAIPVSFHVDAAKRPRPAPPAEPARRLPSHPVRPDEPAPRPKPGHPGKRRPPPVA